MLYLQHQTRESGPESLQLEPSWVPVGRMRYVSRVRSFHRSRETEEDWSTSDSPAAGFQHSLERQGEATSNQHVPILWQPSSETRTWPGALVKMLPVPAPALFEGWLLIHGLLHLSSAFLLQILRHVLRMYTQAMFFWHFSCFESHPAHVLLSNFLWELAEVR